MGLKVKTANFTLTSTISIITEIIAHFESEPRYVYSRRHGQINNEAMERSSVDKTNEIPRNHHDEDEDENGKETKRCDDVSNRYETYNKMQQS